MHNELPPDVVAFGDAVRDRLNGLGGVRFALLAENDDARRQQAAVALSEVGAWDVDPRAGAEDLLAAAQLCRITGAVALPYPVVEQLLAVDGARLALVDPARPWIDHGDLPGEWVGVDVDGCTYRVLPGSRIRSRLGPFVTRATVEKSALSLSPDDVARHLVLGAWRLLGGLEAALELTSSHLVVREQFGKPLAKFQAVQFMVADAAVALAGLEELAKYTAWRLVTAGSLASRVDAVALRLHADDVGREVLHTCHQMLGAIGFCDEHDLSVLDRHLQPLLRLPASAEVLADRLVPAVADGDFDALFTPARGAPLPTSVAGSR
jgi:acyl-CoA dehydrogenase-like protein